MQLTSLNEVGNALKQIKINETKLAQIKIDRDKKLMPLQEKIDKINKKADEQMQPLEAQIAELETQIEEFSRANKPLGISSIAVGPGKITLRKGVDKIELLDEVAKVVEKVRKSKYGRRYIRTKHELDKKAVVKDFGLNKISNKDLEPLGLKVVSEDTFSYALE